MRRSASKSRLEELHNALAETLLDIVKNGEEQVVGEELVRVKASASMLNAARQFLKDNGVEAIPTESNPLGALVKSLPFTTINEDSDADEAR